MLLLGWNGWCLVSHILVFCVFCNEFMALRHLFIYMLTKANYTRVFKALALSLYIWLGGGVWGVYTTAVSDCRSSSLGWQGI